MSKGHPEQQDPTLSQPVPRGEKLDPRTAPSFPGAGIPPAGRCHSYTHLARGIEGTHRGATLTPLDAVRRCCWGLVDVLRGNLKILRRGRARLLPSRENSELSTVFGGSAGASPYRDLSLPEPRSARGSAGAWLSRLNLLEVVRRQVFNLPYRRFRIGKEFAAAARPAGYKPAIRQIDILRYPLRRAITGEILASTNWPLRSGI